MMPVRKTKLRRILSRSLGGLLGLVLAMPSPAQDDMDSAEVLEAPAVVEQAATERDPLGRDTPRSSAIGFLQAGEQGDFERAARYIDFRNLPGNVRGSPQAELAEQLYLVVTRALWLDVEIISDDSAGSVEEGVPDYRERVGRVPTGDVTVDLFMQHVPGERPDTFVWKVSNATVSEIPGLYEIYGYPDWVERFRAHFDGRATFLGVESFKWAILLAAVAVLWPLLWLVFYGLSRVVSSPHSGLYPEVRQLLTRQLPVLVLVVSGAWLLRELGLGATAQKIFKAHTLGTLFATWFLFGVIDLVRAIRREKFLARGRTDAAVLGRPMANALKLLVAMLAVLVWLSNMGVDISALLAGLGVGGIAMALALQKPIEDLFGAVTLYSQRPVSTGDVCRYGNHFGTIEEIGLRSTRIRTQGNTVVSVPNSRLAYEDIENISARRNVWYQPLIRLRIDTSPEQMRDVVTRIRQMLIDDERVLNDVLRVQFRQFGEYSLDVKVHCYVDTTDFNEYLQIAEELNFRILEIVHQAGAHLALPVRSGTVEP